MISDPVQVEAIAQQTEGDLAEVPFALLLHALAVHRRTVVLEIERRPMRKDIVFELGVPVDCRSNLLHETLVRFMVGRGDLTDEQAHSCLQKSTAEGVRVGEVLIREGLISPSGLFKTLQQNLAKKLLDGFTWRNGRFRVREDPPAVESPLEVNVPQLVVIGIGRFATPEEVNVAVGPLVGEELTLHPEPPYPLSDIRLSGRQQELVALLGLGKRIDELAAESTVPFDDIMRLVYALAVLGIAVPSSRVPRRPAPALVAPATPPASERSPASPPATVLSAEAVEARRDDLMALYLDHRTRDAFDLLGVEESAGMVEMEDAFVAYAERFAPWGYHGELESLREKAEELFLAGARAFGELMHVETRNALLVGRRRRREEPRKPKNEVFAIQSDLLDPELQFKKGKVLMEAGRVEEAIDLLQFARDFDPQNALYRAQLAYCRYLHRPESEGESASDELREALRIDPKLGLAHYYAGVVAADLGRHDDAEKHLQRANKLMTGDRRPIEALKSLAESRKKKRRFFGG